ncbi:MAG: imidazole glycerol phosphate synthase subunit HisH [Candidatus Thorarchaeota archaeon]|nr:imidazole glycerol phosphate synthase subunit HisH [Candidatus Thorarchaeota archaeon]
MIAIIDFGMGNLGSIQNMLIRMGYEAKITSDLDTISNSSKLILPGVGAFDKAMSNLKNKGLIPTLNHLVFEKKVPILGICLGMQLLSNRSEEGVLDGLGWIDSETLLFKFDVNENLRIPHMGWNTIRIQKDSCLFHDMFDEPRFYFVHSFYVKCNHNDDILAMTDYGFAFVSSMNRDNIYGVQFHPEKSHKFGMKILKNFAELC